MKKSLEIRQEFIDFFESRGHTFVPSVPVVPIGDPTLLFINAGMNQFKDVFLCTGRRDYTRAVNSQKCIRVSGKHNDLEDVGRDYSHHTFFEMLGNWSFSDYGKHEAIAWAWELLTEVWKLPKERLYATVHLDDDEAEDIWKNETDLGAERIFRFDKDNFWEMGDVGPCGPCSEIHMDLGPEPASLSLAADPQKGVNSGSGRFVEIWNLVFIRYNRQADQSLIPLEEAHVDTGMGLERICAVIQGKDSNYDTDIFQPLIRRVGEISGVDYQAGESGMAHRVIADHARMLAFSLADGVIPGNEGRGYVVRRILRRAARFGRELGVRQPFLYMLVSTVADIMGQAFPELIKRSQHISRVIKAEEEGFGVTLDRGLELFREVAEKVIEQGGQEIGGEDAFKLYDTYGFPLDLTVLMAREKGLEVDEESFRACMESRQKRSRADAKFVAQSTAERWSSRLNHGEKSEFLGYDSTEVESGVLGADEDALVLDATPFYPEAGGQVADRGVIEGQGFKFEVSDVQRSGSLIIHSGEFVAGSAGDVKEGSAVKARIDEQRRLATARNHTATHLLHRILLKELGESATQAGSLVSPDYLRFDFHHYEKIADELILRIETGVNEQIRANRQVSWGEMDHEKAIEQGAMALFGEKYGKRVRVIEVEGFTKELCGGTHVRATGEIGVFVIASESSVAAGIRRIEAFTGERAAAYLLKRSRLLSELEHSLAVAGQELAGRIRALLSEQKALSKELAQVKMQASRDQMDDLIKEAETLEGGVKVLAKVQRESDMDLLKGRGDSFREKCKSGAALFGAVKGDKLIFVCAVTDDLVREGKLKAGDLVGKVARIAGGGGGGKPHLATAGGKKVEKLAEAVEAFPGLVRDMLSE